MIYRKTHGTYREMMVRLERGGAAGSDGGGWRRRRRRHQLMHRHRRRAGGVVVKLLGGGGAVGGQHLVVEADLLELRDAQPALRLLLLGGLAAVRSAAAPPPAAAADLHAHLPRWRRIVVEAAAAHALTLSRRLCKAWRAWAMIWKRDSDRRVVL